MEQPFTRRETLTPEDRTSLEERTGSNVSCLVIIALFFIGAVVAIAMMRADRWFGNFIVAGAGLLLIAIGFLVYLWWQSAQEERRKAQEDLQGGVKHVSVHPLEKQFIDIREHLRRRGKLSQRIEMSYNYYLLVAGKKLEVSETEYYRYKAGQPVELHIAPRSEVVLSFHPLPSKEHPPSDLNRLKSG